MHKVGCSLTNLLHEPVSSAQTLQACDIHRVLLAQ